MLKQIKFQSQSQFSSKSDGVKGENNHSTSQSITVQNPSPSSTPTLEGEAAILKEAFEQFMKGNITKKGLEKIDAVLEADIVVNKSGTEATIVDSDGNSTKLGMNAKKGGRHK